MIAQLRWSYTFGRRSGRDVFVAGVVSMWNSQPLIHRFCYIRMRTAPAEIIRYQPVGW